MINNISKIAFLFIIAIISVVHAQDKNELNRLYSIALQKERNRAYEQAAIQYEKLFRMQPANNGFYQGVKRNLARLEKYQLLQSVIEKRLSTINDAAANADLGMVYYRLGREDAARKQWQNTLARFPKNAMAYIQVASIMMGEGLSSEAIQTYKTGRKKLGDNTAFAVELAGIYASRDEKVMAAAEYLNYYRKNSRQIRWVESQVISYLNSADSLQVLATLRKAIDRESPADVNLLKIYAKCMKSLNRRRAALDITAQIEEIAAKSNRNYRNGEYLNQFAREAFQQGKYDLAFDGYSMLIKRWPKSRYYAEALYRTALVLEQKGEFTAALEQLDNFLSVNTSHFEGNYLRGQIFMRDLHKPEKAIQVFESMRKRVRGRPQQRKLSLALGDAYLQKGDNVQSEKWYREALRKCDSFDQVQKNEVYWKLAQAQFIDKKFSTASATLNRIKQSPTPIKNGDLVNDALAMQFLISDNQADSSGALSLYADYQGADARNDSETAAKILEEIVQQYPASALAPEALISLAALRATQGENEKAENTLRRFIERYAESDLIDEVYFKLARLLRQTNRTNEAAEYLNKILIEYPYSTFLEESRVILRELVPALQ